MKNEERIVELLAESLKNQDIQSERLEKVESILVNATSELENVNSKLDDLVDVVKDVSVALKSQLGIMEKLLDKYDKIDDLEHRIFLLERKANT